MSALWWLVLAAIVIVVAVAVVGLLAIRARRSGTVLAARPTDRSDR